MKNRIKIDIKEFTALKQHFKHNRCFYPNCDEKTIKAHSIQMNGPLKLICDSVDKQEQQVYFLEDELKYIPNAEVFGSHQNEYKNFRNRGIMEASTFRGFCQKHDKIFKDIIEDVNFSGTKEQQFLFMYRAFAYFVHHKISSNKGFGSVLGISNDNIAEANSAIEGINDKEYGAIKDIKESVGNVFASLSSFMDNHLEQIPIELSELDASIKIELDRIILSKDHEKVNFVCRSFEGVFPLVCSTVVSYLQRDRTPSLDGIAYSNYYAITVLPDKQSVRTFIMIASLDETPNAKPQMERFRAMKSSEFTKTISNLIIQRGVNVYFSPRMINLMSKIELEKIISARLERHKFQNELEVKDYNFSLFYSKYLEF